MSTRVENKKYEWRKIFHRWIFDGKITAKELCDLSLHPEDEIVIGKEEVYELQKRKYVKRKFIKVYRKLEI